MNLSLHFTLEEAVHSDTAIRLGIDNTPGALVLSSMKDAAQGMESVRALLGGKPIRVNSWHRCEALERVLTAKDFAAWCSRHGKVQDEAAWREYFDRKGHPKGYCVDFTAPEFGTPEAVAKAIRDSGIPFDQLILEGTWVHLSFGPALRRQVLSATFKDGTPSYSAGIA